jgi:uncharacterized membrane protein YczE
MNISNREDMNNKVLSWFDWFLIAGVVTSNVIYSILTETPDLLGSLACITGVLCVVLVAKGSAARIGCGCENAPVDAAIVGIVDDASNLECDE